jgi:hypothetical protein
MRTIFGALALMLAVSAPAAAQEHGGMMMMEMHPGAHAALMHRDELGLSAGQVARLTAIDSALARTMRQHCEQVRAAGGPNAQTHAALHPRMMAAMDASLREANDVLTADQRARLDSLHAAHHAEMAGHDMAAMHHDSASMAAMHAQLHGSGAECADCCEHMDCCTPAAPAAKP